MKKINLVFAIILLTISSSCRLVDFTIISSKNVTIDVKKDERRVSAWAFSVKGAIDKAIEEAGPGYDALIDGVIIQGFFGYRVKGTPIKTTETKK